ncbi:hypothetical protein G3570_09670 [Balneolaceae bacterium YR4-1]|uniref:Uncharacterized protein n=1 Tax=Halalkalibaculum roseum TaxID=2709311 RepID=A0A6M1SNG1_9BACT|nr:hypothetical protein [Halalkalibaculum roseum]NGP76901.1 hypothetical protein [Halalkalibaculum roseum]
MAAICSFILVPALLAQAQQADSTKRTFFLRPETNSLKAEPHSERSIGSYTLPESGVFGVPEETEYYVIPFKGQEYLDMAVEALREEQRDKLGLNWLFRFLNAISPYVNNQFQFGVYRINDMPVVARDNPLFQSHNSREERN